MQDFVVSNVLSPAQIGQQAEQILYAKHIGETLQKREQKEAQEKQVKNAMVSAELLKSIRRNAKRDLVQLRLCNMKIDDTKNNVSISPKSVENLIAHLDAIETIIDHVVPAESPSQVAQQQATATENVPSDVQASRIKYQSAVYWSSHGEKPFGF